MSLSLDGSSPQRHDALASDMEEERKMSLNETVRAKVINMSNQYDGMEINGRPKSDIYSQLVALNDLINLPHFNFQSQHLKNSIEGSEYMNLLVDVLSALEDYDCFPSIVRMFLAQRVAKDTNCGKDLCTHSIAIIFISHMT